jgi:hypothetical protein
MVKRKRWDKSRPDTKAKVDEIVHGVFVMEGTMVAFPTYFPGATLPIPRDEGHITALDSAKDGNIYGGTSGRAVHVFVGMFHGVTGMVFDLGAFPDANHCPAICCAEDKIVAALNGRDGGRLVSRNYQPLPYDLLQEWGFERTPIDELGAPATGEAIVDAKATLSGESILCSTDNGLHVAQAAEGDMEKIDDLAGRGRIGLGSKGGLFGSGDGKNLWRFDEDDNSLDRNWCPLPEGSWEDGVSNWARNPESGLLYAADSSGMLFSLNEENGFSPALGRTELAPIGAMAATFDGRLFGTCGDGISRLFSYDPMDGYVKDLGIAVSLLERRRYGYQFGAATVGRDGEIVFGEDDDLGHVWLYFPKVLPR